MSLVERIKAASEGMDERSKFIYNFISYAIKEKYFCHDSSRIVWRGNG